MEKQGKINQNNLLYGNLTEIIISSFYKVYNTLGFGFNEKVYENALVVELRKRGMLVEQQKQIEVYYLNIKVGHYISDLIVENIVVIENKSVENICKPHELQLINYLKATGMEIGLLLNFGPEPEFIRKIFTHKK